MDRLLVVTPAIALSLLWFWSFALFGVLYLFRGAERHDRRTHSGYFGYFMDYFLWLIGPIESGVLATRISPNTLTMLSMLVAGGSGVAIATGHMATAGWLYIASGLLDMLDGRLARATNRCTRAGGFLDSIADRWSELFVLSGFAWFLHDSYWLFACLLAIAGSLMVSYTRAKGESLGLKLDGGHLQRPERIAIVSAGTLLTAWFDAASETAEYGVVVIGVALLVTGVGSTITAASRMVGGYRALAREDETVDAKAPSKRESLREKTS